MVFEEENESWFEECREFTERNSRFLMVRVCIKSEDLKFTDVDRLLRMNGYWGKIICDDRYDTHMLIVNMHTQEMISVLNHFNYFESLCLKKKMIDFEVFLQLHICLIGRIRNRIVAHDRTVTFDIPNNG